jgi:epoxyqueuosine reductase
MEARAEELRRRLGALGFDDVRFAAAGPVEGEGLPAWLAAGMHGDMQWMERTAQKRLDPGAVLAGTRSLILLGVSYGPGRRPTGGPEWARYALHADYHDTIKLGLAAAGRALEEIYGVGAEDYRYYVDTGPVLERSWAARAGMGFVGKNAMLISRRHGNWLLLAAILVRVELPSDPPISRKIENLKSKFENPIGLLCGKCTRCLDACPTQAFPAPGVVDSRRCISYQTIENKGVIPRALRPEIGAHLYGCDVCLEVCPWNRFAQGGRRMLLSARDEIAELTLAELLQLTPERFAAVFKGTPIKRVKLAGLLRNACIVAGNSGDQSLLPLLVRLAAHELALVRVHAVWAIRRLGGEALLAETRDRETDAAVLEEYAARD